MRFKDSNFKASALNAFNIIKSLILSETGAISNAWGDSIELGQVVLHSNSLRPPNSTVEDTNQPDDQLIGDHPTTEHLIPSGENIFKLQIELPWWVTCIFNDRKRVHVCGFQGSHDYGGVLGFAQPSGPITCLYCRHAHVVDRWHRIWPHSPAMVPCLEQPYAGFRHKLCQIETPSKTDIRSSQCGISNLNMA